MLDSPFPAPFIVETSIWEILAVPIVQLDISFRTVRANTVIVVAVPLTPICILRN